MLELLTSPEAWISLAVLSAMEIVLGIDNIAFITILCSRLPAEQQRSARQLGLGVALVARLGLLSIITFVMRLTEPLFTLGRPWTGKDLILCGGGLFLLYKATHEIYENVERPEEHQPQHVAPELSKKRGVSYASIIVQIMLLDIVFSLDSVITAVGMAEHIPVMVAAMLIAVGVMVAFAGPIGDFIIRRPSVRILALSFLVLIAVALIMEGTGAHVSKGYIYASMAFSLVIELLNVRRHSRAQRQAF
jgi:predicted tellurium resistance membrane protein TerC